MIAPADSDRVRTRLGFLGTMEHEVTEDFMRRATLARFGRGTDLMAVGDRVQAVPVLLSGTIRVFKIGESGREITLYRFGAGECCVLSADAILGDHLFPALAQAEDDVEVAFVPADAFNDWLARSSGWRRLVFDAMSQRLLRLMDTLDEVAFARMDSRIASLLLERASGAGLVRATHQELADELGSAREVVSRVLEDFRTRGILRLARGTIEVIDPSALAATAPR